MNDLLIEENAFYDAQQLCERKEDQFFASDLSQANDHGIDLNAAARFFVRNYSGTNRFVNNVLKVRLSQYNGMTQSQATTALNIMREEHLGIERIKKESQGLTCFTCDAGLFDTWDELNAHKSQMHGKAPVPEVLAETGPAQVVIEDNTSKLGLDLSDLPDGRYAAPDPSGKNDYIFLMVKRVQKTKEADRRYNYGVIVTGREIVVAGTIEVREWSSDMKEWVGVQRPGDVYRGQFETELDLIMLMPEFWARLFGTKIGKCCICGKTLTDDLSREIGMGLDCEKKENYFRTRPYSYIGRDRPADKMKDIDPNDERYLSGELKVYRKPSVPQKRP